MTKDAYCVKCKSDVVIEVSDDCYCDEDEGAGYSYSDEYGDCDECKNEVFNCPECGEVLP